MGKNTEIIGYLRDGTPIMGYYEHGLALSELTPEEYAEGAESAARWDCEDGE
jgi:hypothetical protein